MKHNTKICNTTIILRYDRVITCLIYWSAQRQKKYDICGNTSLGPPRHPETLFLQQWQLELSLLFFLQFNSN